MVRIIRGKSDKSLKAIAGALAQYGKDHPNTQIDVYRFSPVSVRIRVVDPSFKGLEKSQRHARIWGYLEHLTEEVVGDISMLVLVAPEELKESFGNVEFENPIAAVL